MPAGSPLRIPICDSQLAAIMMMVGNEVRSVNMATTRRQMMLTMMTSPRLRIQAPKGFGATGSSSCLRLSCLPVNNSRSTTANASRQMAGMTRVGDIKTGIAEAVAVMAANTSAVNQVLRKMRRKWAVYHWYPSRIQARLLRIFWRVFSLSFSIV